MYAVYGRLSPMHAGERESIARFVRVVRDCLDLFRTEGIGPRPRNDSVILPNAACSPRNHAGKRAQSTADACVRSSDGSVYTDETLREEIFACRACELYQRRTHAVVGEGVADADVLVVGEAPGAEEDRSGRPFVGRSGKLLDAMLAAIGLSRQQNCYITNVVKCRPPRNRTPTPHETACCARFLHAHLTLHRPCAILVLGRCAAQHMLQTTDGIGKLRGRFFTYQGIPLLATYHPSALLRDEALKRPAWEDLKTFRARLLQLKQDAHMPI